MINAVKIQRFGKMIGGSRRMRRVYSMIRKGAEVDMPILIIGETGSGKELVASELHNRSSRKSGPYVAFNTGAVSQDLVASELFGHKKGAFTGAVENNNGRLREADGGTLFLDEIGTMDARMQVSLLRALDEGKIRPIGAKRDVPINFRLIAATNEDLVQAVKEGRFRSDLLYRLQVLSIKLPALRHRADDIPMLCKHFIRIINDYYHFEIQGVSHEAMETLQEYEWPGNLRELKNVLAQATVSAASGEIRVEHLPAALTGAASQSDFDSFEAAATPTAPPIPSPEIITSDPEPGIVPDTNGGNSSLPRNAEDGIFIPIGTSLEEVQRAYTQKTLAFCGNNKTQAAKLLKISRKALYDKLVRWGNGNDSTA